MKTSPRSFSPLVIIAVAVVGWVLVLSLTLRLFFGASITGGWLIVGGLFSWVAIGMAVLVKEFNEAILVPVCKCVFARNERGFPVPVGPDETGAANWIEQYHDLSRRSELGLNGPGHSRNRPRSIRNTRSGEPIDFRTSFARVIHAAPLAA
jgi:hypothetical protein